MSHTKNHIQKTHTDPLYNEILDAEYMDYIHSEKVAVRKNNDVMKVSEEKEVKIIKTQIQ